MAIGGVVLNFTARTADAVGDIRKLTKRVQDLGDEGRKSGGKLGGLGGVLKGGLAAGAAAAGAGLVALGALLVDAAKAAVEDQQSAAMLAHTLGTIKGVTDEAIAANEEWITSMTLATNVADTDLRTAVGKLTLATGDLQRAQELTKVAVDASAGSGKNLATITDALAKGADGNTAALKRMFPWLDKNHDGTVTLKEAMDGLKGAYKGAAREAAKQDVWATLNTVWGELKESLGTFILPLLDQFSDWFKNPKNRQKIQDVIDKVGDLSSALGDDLVQAIKDAVKWLSKPENQRALQEWATNMTKIASAIGNVIGKIQTLITWVNKLPGNRILQAIGLLPKLQGASASAAAPTATVGLRAAPAAVATQPPPVLVTEEQVYRAVSRLIMRGQGRNGRLVVVG